MIGWVDSLCEDWAAHKIRVHGYPVIVPLASTLGQRSMCTQYKRGKRTGREPIRSVATRGVPKRRFPEVHSENSLAVARAIQGMPQDKLAVLTIHYLYRVPQAEKIDLVRQLHGKPLSLRTYWRRIHGAHCWIAAKIA